MIDPQLVTTFDLPAAKRVRRADLYSPPASPAASEPDAELAALLHSRLSHLYGPSLTAAAATISKQQQQQQRPTTTTTTTTTTTVTEASAPAEQDAQAGFEFRLFAAPPADTPAAASDGTNGAPPAPRIMLEDDGDADADETGGFVVPRRDERYYFTGAVAAAGRARERRREFEAVAVSGEDVRRWLGVRYPGCEVKWRVKHLRNGEEVFAVVAEASEAGVAGVAAKSEKVGTVPLAAGLGPHLGSGIGVGKVRKRGKPGKKRRIVLRVRKRKEEEAAERRRQEKERRVREDREREEAEREKRTRRNREKKVKKKMKEKEKKARGGGGGLGNAEVDDDSEGE